MSRILPVLTVAAAILALWYAGAVWLNAQWERDQAARAGREIGWAEILPATMRQTRPVLPAPHQVAAELWNSIALTRLGSKRNLLHHAGITLSAALIGALIGTLLGIGLAVLIVHDRATEMSVMPWVVASQTIPILAIAPMLIGVMAAIGLQGLVPKALISTYLSFFPVVVGMVQGFRSPDRQQLDLMRTYAASPAQVFWRLRWPAALPALFASLKVAVAISVVGAIVAELPTGAVEGLGARLLAGSYYGQTVQIWAALVAAAVLSALLVAAVGLTGRLVGRAMGARP